MSSVNLSTEEKQALYNAVSGLYHLVVTVGEINRHRKGEGYPEWMEDDFTLNGLLTAIESLAQQVEYITALMVEGETGKAV